VHGHGGVGAASREANVLSHASDVHEGGEVAGFEYSKVFFLGSLNCFFRLCNRVFCDLRSSLASVEANSPFKHPISISGCFLKLGSY
jgi:hypothetical protein